MEKNLLKKVKLLSENLKVPPPRPNENLASKLKLCFVGYTARTKRCSKVVGKEKGEEIDLEKVAMTV